MGFDTKTDKDTSIKQELEEEQYMHELRERLHREYNSPYPDMEIISTIIRELEA